jgi:microcystin-dependent protein
MNGDGKIDLVATNVNSPVNFNKLFIYPGDGTGGFGTRTEINLPGALFENSSYILDDFNRDGKTDIVVQYSANVLVYLNNGTGAFSPLTATTILAGSEKIIRMADINGDGRLDLITFAQPTFVTSYRLANPDGTFGARVQLEQINSTRRNEGDFDGDGDLDFAVTNTSGTNYALQIYFNQGNGTFTPGNTLTTLDSRDYFSPVVADFNNDGKPDVLFGTGNIPTPKAAVLINQGNNTFAPPNNITQFDPTALAPKGGSLPHNNMQPYLTLNFCIALQGVFPPRT